MQKKVCELFAGVGGFRIGLESSGDWEVAFANQWEPGKKIQHAFDCYSHHFPKGIHINKNISEIDTKEIPKHELLVGGFPCQDYSVARTGAKGIEGKKGVLFWEIKRILQDKQPHFALLENVDRLLKSPSNQRGRDFGMILATLRDLGYGVEWRVINAADYGFVQKRKRTFIFAFKKDTRFYEKIRMKPKQKVIHENGFFQNQFPIEDNPSEKHPSTSGFLPNDILEVSDDFAFIFRNSGIMLDGEIYSEEIIPRYIKPKTLGEILEKDVEERFYIKKDVDKWKYLKDAKRFERTNKAGYTYIYTEGQMSFPDPLDRPGRTILTSEGTKNRSSHVIEDPQTKRLRILTPIECERLNGFPDNWTNTGMTEKFRYFVMGNALVTGLIGKMGKTLNEIFELEK